MQRAEIEAWVHAAVSFSYSRSGGPGGQNVNKVNTKVLATVPLDDGSPLTDVERERIEMALGTRINSEGALYVQSQRGRTQLENRRLATARLIVLLSSALQVTKPRKATRPSRRTQERRLQYKREISEKKRRRSWRRDAN